MNYFIIDKTTKELIGLFKSTQEADLYYLKNNVVERLKIYRHKLLDYTTDNTDRLWELRAIEELMEQIFEFDETAGENTYSYIQGYLNRATALLINHKPLNLSYTVQRFDENNIRKINLN